MNKLPDTEMTYEEFIDALKKIISKDGDLNESEKKEKVSFWDDLKDEFKQMQADIKYLFSKEILNDIKKIFISSGSFIKSIFTLSFLKDFFKDKETEEKPLTKAEFIRKGKKMKAAIKDTLETIIFVIVMVIIIRFFIGEIRWIPSGSMRPTLLEGDRIFVERYSRFYKTPERGDIMVFYPPSEQLKNTPGKLFARLTGFFCKDIAYIKRVIGMPGDKFEIKTDNNGKSTVFINDEPLDEKYVKSSYEYSVCTEAMYCGPFTIPEHNYFMMGDNRGNSQDSRYWGFLDEKRFVGKAIFLFWPINRIKNLN